MTQQDFENVKCNFMCISLLVDTNSQYQCDSCIRCIGSCDGRLLDYKAANLAITFTSVIRLFNVEYTMLNNLLYRLINVNLRNTLPKSDYCI